MELLALTKDSKTGEEPAEEVDANRMLEKALARLQASIHETGAIVTHTALPPVRIHEFQLAQLFQNLIGNAMRYRSAESPRIAVAASDGGSEWIFSVKDNGIGIDPQYKEQIFGIFKRLHSTAAYPGTGMGLAICQRIIDRIGGRIWVESDLGIGSTFFFTVPHGETRRLH